MKAPSPPLRALLMTALSPLFAACTVGTLNAIIPSDGYRSQTNVAYGPDPRQRLDVHVPVAAAPADGRPVAVWIYGGSWQSGARGDYAFIADTLAALGWITVIPDYRLFPEVRFPAFVEDTAQAVAWTRSEQARDILGPTNGTLVLMGHSAGAYNAAMVAYDPQWLRAARADPAMVSGFVGLAGPYNLFPYDVEVTKRVFGHETDPTVVEPLSHITAASPPALLVTGLRDTVVGPYHTDAMEAALAAKGVDHRTVRLADANHAGVVLGLTRYFRDKALTVPLAAFLKGLEKPAPRHDG
ncbi:carboxylesterase family protein [Rhodospirillum rubrum ATCC 11170]|uniref:Carboxylesterase family protein n=2 Tax=Rhodospirillum rubrum TaxID=1085 RepID=Q2RSU8_RHORT|nr:carboxylesterase family protein [Rhodospirillum rubrum ATCC 11170]MBK5954394.1 alpha/beta hydrolase [Rhodospirillum rubrum]HCF16652.1 alpha/beta hydrolase [Rhodospirillum rubrum]